MYQNIDISLNIYYLIVVKKYELSKKELCDRFNRKSRSIQNYISMVNCFLRDNFEPYEIINDRKVYKVVKI